MINLAAHSFSDTAVWTLHDHFGKCHIMIRKEPDLPYCQCCRHKQLCGEIPSYRCCGICHFLIPKVNRIGAAINEFLPPPGSNINMLMYFAKFTQCLSARSAMAVPEILSGIRVFLDDSEKVRNFCTITAITPAICLYSDILEAGHGDDTEDELDTWIPWERRMDEALMALFDEDYWENMATRYG